jgi:fumarate hydratase subunit beta
VRIGRIVYVVRDVARKGMVEAVDNGKPLPFDRQGQIVYQMGPTLGGTGKPIGSPGPTTSYRMDPHEERPLQVSLKAIIAKGDRSVAAREAILPYKAVCFAATGGTHALLA